MFVKPELPVLAGVIVPDVEVIVEQSRRVLVPRIGPVDQAGIAEIDELRRVARTKQRMVNDHSFTPPAATACGRRP